MSLAKGLSSPTATWLTLLGATLLSFVSWLDAGRVDGQLAGNAVIVIAMGKVWLIGMRFMELDRAFPPLRFAFNLWVIVVGAVLLTMFWTIPK